MNIIPPDQDAIPDVAKNVIAINPDIDAELAIQRANGEKKYKCSLQHKSVLVDPINRTVTCQTCGYVIDAFDYLLSWADEADRRMRGLKGLAVKDRLMRGEIAKLERQLESIRGKLKREGFPQPQVERWAFKNEITNAQWKAESA